MVTACCPARLATTSRVRALAVPLPMSVTALPPVAKVYASVALAVPVSVPVSAW